MPVINPNTLSSFEVLFVETDNKTIQHHEYAILQNSYRVTLAMKISEALSMVINRRTFDCILLDAENCDMDLVEFLQNIWILQPQMRILVITSNENHMQLGKENLAKDVIWFLRKPIGVNSICNVLQHVCISKVLGKGITTENPLEVNQNSKIVQTVGATPSPTIFESTMINNNTSSSNGTLQGLIIDTQKYGAICKPVSHVDISGDDDVDEARTNKSILTRTTDCKDKGKKPMELKRKNEPPAEVDINRLKRKDINSRTVWTPTPYRNYLEPLISSGKEVNDINSTIVCPPVFRGNYLEPLTSSRKEVNDINSSFVCPPSLHGNYFEPLITSSGKEGAYPKAIQNQMNMLDNTREVASHLKKIEERATLSMKSRAVPGPMKKNIDNNASMQNSSSIQRKLNHNSNGASFVTLNKIMARGGPQLPLPPCTTTTINNSGGDQIIQPPIGSTFMSNDFGLTGNFHSGGSPVSGGMELVDRFGIPVASHVSIGGGGEASSSVGLDDHVPFPPFMFQDLEDLFNPQPFLGTGETLFGFENSVTFNNGQASTSASPPSISGAENNSEAEVQPSGDSILPYQDSEGRVIDNDWYLNLIHEFDL